MVKSLYNLRSLDPFFIGFERLWDEIENAHSAVKQRTYPPYNIIHHDESNFTIEMAVAGFDEDDIGVQVRENILHIEGSLGESDEKSDDILHRGIANREFTRQFTLANDIEVVEKDCSLKKGMLTIKLKRVIPETKKPKLISINKG